MSTHHDDSIEPLSEATWARIEQQIFTRLAEQRGAAQAAKPRSRRGPLQWGLAAAAVALLATAGLRSWPATSSAAPQRHVALAREEAVALPGVRVLLEPGSIMESARQGAASDSCELLRGAARFEVAPRNGRAPFVVHAGEVRVEVIGTVFRVARSGAGVEVETTEGTVRVRASGQQTLVHAGQRWPSVPAPARAAQSSSEITAPPAANMETTRKPPARRSGLAERQRVRFEAAAAVESSDPQRALRGYEALSRESGPWASNALFALGRLELERRQLREAERDLQRYLERYPQGANAADARALLQRVTPATPTESPGP